MDSVTHGSVSVLIGLIFIQFYKDTPLWLLILVMFVFGVLIDYDHVFFYKRKFPDIKTWNIPQLIKVYFKTLDDRDEFIYHTWMQEPAGIVVVSGISYLLFGVTKFYPPVAILAVSCYVGHYLIDLLSGKMKPLAPFNNKITIDLKFLPPNAFTAATISLATFLIGLLIFLYI